MAIFFRTVNDHLPKSFGFYNQINVFDDSNLYIKFGT